MTLIYPIILNSTVDGCRSTVDGFAAHFLRIAVQRYDFFAIFDEV